MSLQQSIFIYLFVTRVNIINILPCVIGSFTDSVDLCQCDGPICKMKEGKLKKMEGPCFSHKIESHGSLVHCHEL